MGTSAIVPPESVITAGARAHTVLVLARRAWAWRGVRFLIICAGRRILNRIPACTGTMLFEWLLFGSCSSA